MKKPSPSGESRQREIRELAASLGQLLLEENLMLACAESCTGGLVGALITANPGSSSYYLGGVVSYANSAKLQLLGVSESTLSRHGAVSDHVAAEMALGARRVFGADIALSITGIAGPDGGSEAKPVGTVWIGQSDSGGASASHYRFEGDREAIRLAAAYEALDTIFNRLLRG